jgi:glycosyltransferase involved in cell wall biosynthesis
MNILFISLDADPPNKGGTSTVVNVLAKYFVSKGHKIALGYLNKSDTPSVFFKEKIFLSYENKENVIKFFKHNSFDIIYNTMGMDTDWNLLNEVKGSQVKIVSAYHNRPWLRFFSIETILLLLQEAPTIIRKLFILRLFALYPIKKIISQNLDKRKFINMYNNSDKILLLSNKFFPIFKNLCPKAEEKHVIAIPNPIVFDEVFDKNKIINKQKKVLVVTSINYQKRPNLMIKIWNEIEKDNNFNEWEFDFVGGGVGYKTLIKQSKRYGLKRIHFFEYQNPLEFYRKASVFLMTSRFEGWPMVLMESMQMGVVPIVFNSFESLPEIIDDGCNGVIIENNSIDLFVEKLKALLEDTNKRTTMAIHAIDKVSNFALEKIGKRYEDFFTSLLNQF